MAENRCVHLAIRPDADGNIRARKDWAYGCAYPMEQVPAMPVSITHFYDFKWPPIRSHVTLDMCNRCPCKQVKERLPPGQLL